MIILNKEIDELTNEDKELIQPNKAVITKRFYNDEGKYKTYRYVVSEVSNGDCECLLHTLGEFGKRERAIQYALMYDDGIVK